MTDALEPAFLANHDKVPFTIRDVLLEADGCIQHGFLLGGTACARRGLEMALIAAKADGDTYEARVKSLHQKNGVTEMLTTILVQSGDSGGRDAAKLSAKALELFVATIKAVLYESVRAGAGTDRTPAVYPPLGKPCGTSERINPHGGGGRRLHSKRYARSRKAGGRWRRDRARYRERDCPHQRRARARYRERDCPHQEALCNATRNPRTGPGRRLALV